MRYAIVNSTTKVFHSMASETRHIVVVYEPSFIPSEKLLRRLASNGVHSMMASTEVTLLGTSDCLDDPEVFSDSGIPGFLIEVCVPGEGVHAERKLQSYLEDLESIVDHPLESGSLMLKS